MPFVISFRPFIRAKSYNDNDFKMDVWVTRSPGPHKILTSLN